MDKFKESNRLKKVETNSRKSVIVEIIGTTDDDDFSLHLN